MAKAIVHSPVKGFTGTVVGAKFENGAADVDEEGQLAYFERQGYQVTYAPESQAVVIPEGEPADTWKVDQLKTYAESKSIDLGDAKKKDEILTVLTAAKEAADKAAADAKAAAQKEAADKAATEKAANEEAVADKEAAEKAAAEAAKK